MTFAISDLAGMALGQTTGALVTIDADGAGWGWSIFGGDPSQRMDLLTVLLHELGHVLGYAHGDGLMADTLSAGETRSVASDSTGTTVSVPADWLVVAPDGVVHAIEVKVADGNIDLTLDGVMSSKSVSSVAKLAITGGNLADTLTIDSSVVTSGIQVLFDGRAGVDRIRGPPATLTWTLTAPGTGTVGSVSFTGVEDLEGAVGNEDTFVFEAAGSLTGTVDGGDAGYDTLVIHGGDYAVVTSTVTGPQSGVIALDSQQITYAGLEPILISTGSAAAVTFTLSSAAVNTLTLGAATTPGKLVLTSGNGTFETTEFLVPTTSLMINLGSLGDTITINELDPFVRDVDADGHRRRRRRQVRAQRGDRHRRLQPQGNAGNDRFTVAPMTTNQVTLLGGADIDVLVSAPGVDVTLTDASFVAGGLSVAIASIETATLVAPTLNAASTFSGVISLLASEASWTPVGPFSTTGGQVEGMEPQGNPVAGAINIVVVDPLHPNIAYAASPNGGIWKTTDFLATTTVINPQGGTMTVPAPTWTPLTDLSPSLSISTLTIDPADPNVLYAGTGVTSSSQEGGPVVGLFKTSDAGATWTPIGGTAFNKLRINRILVFHGSLSEKLLVGTSGGLYTTGLNGESPTKVSGGLPDGVISDLIRKAPDSTTVPAPPRPTPSSQRSQAWACTRARIAASTGRCPSRCRSRSGSSWPSGATARSTSQSSGRTRPSPGFRRRTRRRCRSTTLPTSRTTVRSTA